METVSADNDVMQQQNIRWKQCSLCVRAEAMSGESKRS
jgi:hypothetical protein